VSACPIGGTFLSCNGQAGTSAPRAEVGDNNERDTAKQRPNRQGR